MSQKFPNGKFLFPLQVNNFFTVRIKTFQVEKCGSTYMHRAKQWSFCFQTLVDSVIYETLENNCSIVWGVSTWGGRGKVHTLKPHKNDICPWVPFVTSSHIWREFLSIVLWVYKSSGRINSFSGQQQWQDQLWTSLRQRAGEQLSQSFRPNPAEAFSDQWEGAWPWLRQPYLSAWDLLHSRIIQMFFARMTASFQQKWKLES